jgi:ABC-type uncharacterized transport system substrate-binding protein
MFNNLPSNRCKQIDRQRSTGLLYGPFSATGAVIALWLVMLASCVFMPAVVADTGPQRVLILHQPTSGFTQQLITRLQHDLSSQNILVENALQKNPGPQEKDLDDYQLIIAVGSRTSKALLDENHNTAMLSLLIPENLALGFAQLYPQKEQWHSLLIDQPLERYFHLISALLGEQADTGLILGTLSETLRVDYQKAANNTGHSLQIENIQQTEQLTESIKFLSQRSDVLLMSADPEIYNKNTIRGILLSSYRHRLPVIGFSKSLTHAGAIAAIYSEPEQISQQAVKISQQILRGETTKKTYSPENFSVSVNFQVARSLGYRFSDEDTIIQLIKAYEKQQ